MVLPRLPNATGKQKMSYAEFVQMSAEQMLRQQWHKICLDHARDGCPLDDYEPQVCIIHGYFKGDRELTLKDWLGD